MNPHFSPRHELRRLTLMGFAVLVVIFVGVGGWAVVTPIAGAVITQGSLVVESHVKKVQHPQGGVVTAIHKHNGDWVEAGELLARLDDTVARANMLVASKALDELDAKRARLEAERENWPALIFPDRLLKRADEPVVAQVMANERSMFESRKVARRNLEKQLERKIEQLRQEIPALQSQHGARGKEIELVEKELKGARELAEKKLYPITKLTALERDAARLQSERTTLVSAMAKAEEQITENELKLAQIQHELVSEAAKELQNADARTGEMLERRVVAEDHFRRTEIRSPQAGWVHQSVVHTVGGVVNGGEILMSIVPRQDQLVIDARLDPMHVDQAEPGQKVLARFTAFNQRTTPEIHGRVVHIAADVSRDEKSGQPFFPMRIALENDELLQGIKLVPGMMAEVFVLTGERSVLSYLLKPLSDQIMRAFRER